MAKNLVIVESPAKIKTITKFLGKDFHVLASYGHIREIPSKDTSIDINDNFKIKYVLSDLKKKYIEVIKKSTRKSKNIYLATDPDREGESISWHIKEVLNDAKLLKDKNIYRISFNEITKSAVLNAIENPKHLSMLLVSAQKARQALDFLVGFNLSPLLWRKITNGLSAGRVQSPVLRMIVEREVEREKFVKKNYWSLTANLFKQKQLLAHLIESNKYKIHQFTFTSKKAIKLAKDKIIKDAKGFLIVDSMTEKKSRKKPYPPFITSTLQQEAFKKLGFTAKKTMIIAQKIYEGIYLGGNESIGLISYMRTDSTNLSKEALNNIRSFIKKKYDLNMLPAKPVIFKKKAQNAQEAHESIRVTSITREPDTIKKHLSQDEYKLYRLIWNRTIACQMKHATLSTKTIDLITENHQYKFRITNTVIVNAGFLSLYQAEKDDDESYNNEAVILPKVKKGEKINLRDVIVEDHSTEPPPRYTEASLIKALEKYGIGRPSTYTIMTSTLKQRKYIEIINRRFIPSDKGIIVNNFLTEHFKKYIEYSYTARLEKELDDIAHGKNDYLSVLKNFWNPFIKRINTVSKNVSRKDVVQKELSEDCPECKNKLSLRFGKNGCFIGCTNYPECTYTRRVNNSKEKNQKEKEDTTFTTNRKCPICKSNLYVKQGLYGKFIGCSNYPKCKHLEPLEKPKDTGIVCPQCNQNNIAKKKSRKGKIFYACYGFPRCKNAYWYPPVKELCQKCNSPILLTKIIKNNIKQKVCPNKECDYAVNLKYDIV